MNQNVKWALRGAAPLLAAAVFSVPTPVQASIYIEFGNAGQTPGTAQTVGATVPPSAQLTQIQGTLPSSTDSDVYRILITNPSIFSANVNTTDANADTQVYLFTAAGAGIAFNDDEPGGSDFNGALPA